MWPALCLGEVLLFRKSWTGLFQAALLPLGDSVGSHGDPLSDLAKCQAVPVALGVFPTPA